MKNALLVTIDSLRADHVGCYGYDRDTTPVIDDIATEATVFENAFAHSCSTRPSFPSILTSSYPMMYGGFKTLSEERTLVSEVFNDAGYRTAGFHSNAYLNPEFGYGRGFDTLFDSTSDSGYVAQLRHYVKNNLDKDGLVYQTLETVFSTAERQTGTSPGSAYVDADEITNDAIEWVADTDPDQPDFLWVHYMDVHHPYLPPEEYQLAFRDEPISDRRAIQLRRKFLEDPEAVTESELTDIIDLYDAEIRFTDAEIGRLIDAVSEYWDEYVLAVTADHGEEFRDHGEFSHYAKFYDEVIHVPFVFEDYVHQGRYDELVGLIDVSPTVVDAAGLSAPDNFHGHSLLSLLEDEVWPREKILCDWAGDPEDNRRLVYRDHEWKYIKRERGEELYNLSADPDEQINLVDEEPDILNELRAAVADHDQYIDETDTDVERVEMSQEVKGQLRNLGYKE